MRFYHKRGLSVLSVMVILLILVGQQVPAFLLSGFLVSLLIRRVSKRAQYLPGRFFGLSAASWLSGTVISTIFLLLLADIVGITDAIEQWLIEFKWDEFGSWAEWLGSAGGFAAFIVAVVSIWYVYRQISMDQTAIIQATESNIYNKFKVDTEPRFSTIHLARMSALAQVRPVLANPYFGKEGIALLLTSLSLYLTLCAEEKSFRKVSFDDDTGKMKEDWINGIRLVPLDEIKERGRSYFENFDFSYTNLAGVILAGFSLCRSDFTGADLSDANFIRTDVSGANFTEAYLVGLRFHWGPTSVNVTPMGEDKPSSSSGAGTGMKMTDALFWGATMNTELYAYLMNFGSQRTRNSLRTAIRVQTED